ncbi:hydroxyproline O-galactosyltransferase HPGT1-like [Andrographis paniculata]|uniref:hydroxyproline O-galactosyltransferase HPGT1-like n=1 Tax=Andrographis paniculata TaxID=175694 RepID=UPI0021E97EC1|nr:hydroxyproline O-galactosyltransferase HPGT1-like [Andrographis paniculata]
MGSRGSNHRLSSAQSFGNRISLLMLSMFATMASLYVAGRLWQDAANRANLISELDMRTGQGKSSVSVDDTLKIINCRERHKILDALNMDLEKARQEGFVSKRVSGNGGTSKRKLLAAIGIITMFGRKNNRNAIRKAWMPTGAALKELEEEKGLVIRFVIGRSANRGDNSDRDIDSENAQSNDIIILENHIERPEERANKTKLFLIHAVDHWEAEFYIKINDDVYVNIDALGAVLASHLDKPRVYIGCMKSGEVFSDLKHKWYEPEWWKFGDGKSYFRHASGEIFAISHALAQFVSINRFALRTYAHDDVSVGSWFIGLNVEHVDDEKFCCSSSSGAVCASA